MKLYISAAAGLATVALTSSAAFSAAPAQEPALPLVLSAPAALSAPVQAPASDAYVVLLDEAVTPGMLRSANVVKRAVDQHGRKVAVLATLARNLDALATKLPRHGATSDAGTPIAGYRSFGSMAEVDAFLSQTAEPSFALATYTIDQQTVVNSMLPAVVTSNIYNTIDHLSNNYPNRYYTTQNAKNAGAWVKQQYQNYSAGRTDVTTESNTTACSRCGGMPLIIHTIKGTELPNEYVVIGGHYDSTVSGGVTSESTRAPGADDNASSQGVILETVRVLHAKGWKPKRTVVFFSYPAEEVGLLGSEAAATMFKNQGKNVVAAMNFDMTNYLPSTTSYEFAYVSDNTDSNLNTFVKSLITTYLPGNQVTTMDCGYECSDHAPWTNKGYPSVAWVEPVLFPKLHTTSDTLSNMGNTAEPSKKFAQLALAFAVEVGKTSGSTAPDPGDPGDPGTPAPGALSNGVAVPISAASGTELNYTVTVPAGASNLVIATSGGTGDADLYVKAGSAPTDSSYDCRPYQGGSSETCTFATPVVGTYYVRVKAYSTFSGVSLKASWTESGTPTPTPSNELLNGAARTVAGASGSWTEYVVNPPVGSSLTVSTSGGTGDADMYVRQGTKPTTSTYDCRPYKSGNAESCTLTVTGPVYVALRGYTTYSGVSLVARW